MYPRPIVNRHVTRDTAKIAETLQKAFFYSPKSHENGTTRLSSVASLPVPYIRHQYHLRLQLNP